MKVSSVPCPQHPARPPQVMLRSGALAALRRLAAASSSGRGAPGLAAAAAAASRGGGSGSGSDAPLSTHSLPPLQPPPRRSQRGDRSPDGSARRVQRSSTRDLPPPPPPQQQQRWHHELGHTSGTGAPTAPYTQRAGFSTAAAPSGLENGVVQGAKVVSIGGSCTWLCGWRRPEDGDSFITLLFLSSRLFARPAVPFHVAAVVHPAPPNLGGQRQLPEAAAALVFCPPPRLHSAPSGSQFVPPPLLLPIPRPGRTAAAA